VANYYSGLAVANNNTIYISTASAIHVYNSTGNIVQVINYATPLSGTIQIAWSAFTGDLFLVLLQKIQIINNNGTVLYTFLNSDANLQGPELISINSANGNIAIVDSIQKVKVFNNNGVFLFSISSNFFNSILDLVFDPNNGNIIVCDSYYGVQIYDSTGTYLYTIQYSGYPYAITVDKNSNIFVHFSGSYNITAFNSIGNFSFTFGGYTTTGETGKFSTISALKHTYEGNIAVADYYYSAYFSQFRIQTFYPNGTFISAIQFDSQIYFFIGDGNNDFLTYLYPFFAFYNRYGGMIVYLEPPVVSTISSFDIFQDNLYACYTLLNKIEIISTNGAFTSYSTNPTTVNCF